MKSLKDKDIDKVLAYLRASLLDCLYLYIDLKTYGLTDKNVLFWYTEDSAGHTKGSARLNTVVMKYYDSFQIFSEFENWSLDEILSLLNEIPVKAINGP